MLFSVALICSGQSFKISGYIYDFETGEPLAGANIVNPNNSKGIVSDFNGRFSIQVEDSLVFLKISYVGYETVTKRIEIWEGIDLKIGLKPGNQLDEIIVSDSLLKEPVVEVNRIIVPVQKIQSLPVFLSEPDILKTLQLLPGVQSGTEGSAGIYVRGGGPDQNLLLLDNIPIYNASHLFGFFSSFNPGIIDNIELIKGGFPARYGGRLSSVINITTKEGSFTDYNAEGSIGLITSNFTISGPVKREKLSFTVGIRRSYIDLFLIPFTWLGSQNNDVYGYYLQDINAKLNWKISEKHNSYLTFYRSVDNGFAKSKIKYQVQDSQMVEIEDLDKINLKWGNTILSSGINSQWSRRFSTNTIIAFNQYDYRAEQLLRRKTKFEDIEENSEEYNMANISRISDLIFKMDALFGLNRYLNFRFGTGLTQHIYKPDVIEFTSNIDENFQNVSGNIPGTEGFAYFENELNLKNGSKLNLGIHGSIFRVNGKNYQSLQPRISTDFILFPGFHLNGSYSHMAQFTHLLTNSGIGMPTDLWVPATDRIKPQYSQQFTFGFLKDFTKGFSFSIEGYHKRMQNLIEYKEGARIADKTINWQDKIESGNGEAYGLEFLFQKRSGKLTGWFGYTLSRSLRQFDNLNNGNLFPYKYDRIHDISISTNYKLNPKIDISASWVFGTGIAFTAPVYRYPTQDEILFNWSQYSDHSIVGYSNRNAARYPNYHRLDLSIQFRKKRKWGERYWVISIFNVYNRKNPFYMTIKDEGRLPNTSNPIKRLEMHSYFQIIPSISYRFVFGK